MASNLSCWCELSTIGNWVGFGHALLVFIIMAQFWRNKTGQIGGFHAYCLERIRGINSNFISRCILTSYRISLLTVVPFGLWDTVQIWGLWVLSWERMVEMASDWARWCMPLACWCSLPTFKTVDVGDALLIFIILSYHYFDLWHVATVVLRTSILRMIERNRHYNSKHVP